MYMNSIDIPLLALLQYHTVHKNKKIKIKYTHCCLLPDVALSTTWHMPDVACLHMTAHQRTRLRT